MEIGTGVAIAGSVWAVAAVIMTVMKKDNASNTCMSHQMLSQQVKNIEGWLEKVESKLDKVIDRIK
jgi:hypothetical protein